MSKPLPPTQQTLIDVIRAGHRVLRTSDYPKRWRRSDTWGNCTNAAQGLILRGAVTADRADPPVRFYDYELKITEPA